MNTFHDRDGDTLEVEPYERWVRLASESSGLDPVSILFTPSCARAVAAEIIACADRIEGKESRGPECSECHERRIQEDSDASANWTPNPASTPTNTSHASLVVFAKAIAYLPTPMRDELNALLASKLRVALS